ncbi:hypothetical protein SEVIR_7G088501v4 [Setaria viridis]
MRAAFCAALKCLFCLPKNVQCIQETVLSGQLPLEHDTKALQNNRFVERGLNQLQIFSLEHMILFVLASCLLLLGECVPKSCFCLLI